MSLILFGFKSSGKTHFGKLLAKELKWSCIDTDDLVEELYEKRFLEKLSCRQISLKQGEAFFRAMEKETIHSLQTEKPAIISLGGGAILDPDNCKSLQSLGTLVYLEADKESLKTRILSGVLPSFINPENPEDSFEKMYQMRKPLYERMEAIKVNTAGKLVTQIVKELKGICHG